ncbi:Mannose-6-phosphate isomerase [Borealophlyctis nickersoniae]|nr:Mannose-6-phosphate isomerase [Borealophlyctis nickersoniae]
MTVNNRQLLATTALHLATKQCEVPRKLRDVINVGYWTVHQQDGSDRYLNITEEYWAIKESTFASELVLLRVLGFDLNVDTPYPHIVSVMDELIDESLRLNDGKPSDDMWRSASALAWTYAGDSFLSADICLAEIPSRGKCLALACVYLALRTLGMELPRPFHEWCQKSGGGATAENETMSSESSVVRLVCKTQSYDWGKLGNESKVAELASATAGFTPRDDAPYAELWMGTHPNGASVELSSQKPLKDLLTKDNLGEKLHAQYQGDLPFLFKVLSIRKALSIQAHPDKALAKELAQKRPDLYKDPNHKPEMAIALTPFEALIAFRPLSEIASHLRSYPEFADLLGSEVTQKFLAQVESAGTSTSAEDANKNKEALRLLFKTLMESEQDAVSKHVQQLVRRIENEGKAGNAGSLDELVFRLNRQFPNDIGIFCALLLNYVTLVPGEAIFLAANEPHAYLSGGRCCAVYLLNSSLPKSSLCPSFALDCVECMAASDNVVRSGLTPKFKDVNTLVRMLTYNYGPADRQILRGDRYQGSSRTTLYDPPIDEFSILRTVAKLGEKETVKPIAGPSILIVTEGLGKLIYREGGVEKFQTADQGYVFFISAGVEVTHEGKDGDFVSYRAFCA